MNKNHYNNALEKEVVESRYNYKFIMVLSALLALAFSLAIIAIYKINHNTDYFLFFPVVAAILFYVVVFIRRYPKLSIVGDKLFAKQLFGKPIEYNLNDIYEFYPSCIYSSQPSCGN